MLDNTDDEGLIFGTNSRETDDHEDQQAKRLVDYMPRNTTYPLLITTRDKRVGLRLMNREGLINLPTLSEEDARTLLRAKVSQDANYSSPETSELLKALQYLPLAIAQAGAYISEEDITIKDYLRLLQTNIDAKDLIEQNYYDPARDRDIQNAIFPTWKVSFDQIRKRKPRSAEILSLMAVLDRQSIAKTLLQNDDERKVALDTALGTLKAFSLIKEEQKGEVYVMHRLVQLSTQLWLESRKTLSEWQEKAMDIIEQQFAP